MTVYLSIALINLLYLLQNVNEWQQQQIVIGEAAKHRLRSLKKSNVNQVFKWDLNKYNSNLFDIFGFASYFSTKPSDVNELLL